MHWADRIADSLIAHHPGRDEFHLASGTTPSGPVHCGNLRDFLTNWFVARALTARGKRVRYIHSWDNYDRFRKVPKNVPDTFAAEIGKPVADVPDPWGKYPSYAERYEQQFERSLTGLGIEVEYRRQAQLYRAREYNASIVEAVRKRGEIYDIIASFRTQKGSEGERQNYYVVEIYCPVCRKDAPKFTSFDDATLDYSYRCPACGHEGAGNIATADHLKLPWKVDWAMRWRHEQILFEPGGKDHGTAGGSYEVASRVAREIFGYEPPVFEQYEFIGIKGLAGKMSGSSGNVITLEDALRIYQPEVLLWVFARMAPNRAFDLVLDRQIFQVYDEFDRALAAAPAPGTEIADRRAIELAAVDGRAVTPVPFRQLVSFSGTVRGNRAALTGIFQRLGTPFTEAEFGERLEKAQNWIAEYAPEEDVRLLDARRDDYLAALPPERRNWITALHAWLAANEPTVETANERIYAIPQETASDTPVKERQKAFFGDVYQLLFGRSAGPRLATFFGSVQKADYLHLLG